MKVIAVNGSPRNNGNTAVLLQNALRGAEANGAQTELINLYQLDFKGCISCFSCKRKGSQCKGLCAVKDDLTGVLERILSGDSILLGSPIYLGNVTGEMRSFWERLIFPSLTYNEGQRTIFQGRIASGFIYTMNAPEAIARQVHYDKIFEQNKNLLKGILRGDSEFMASYDTYQFHDYSLYEASRFDEAHKAEVKAKQFPADCQKAYEMGIRLTSCSGNR